MAIQVLLKRRTPEGLAGRRFTRLMRSLLARANTQAGCIPRETLKRLHKPKEYPVIGTLQAIGTRKESQERRQLQEQIDLCWESKPSTRPADTSRQRSIHRFSPGFA